MTETPDGRLTQAKAFERARAHDAAAKELRAQAAVAIGRAETHERWAKNWRDWADDDYGNVEYPGRLER